MPSRDENLSYLIFVLKTRRDMNSDILKVHLNEYFEDTAHCTHITFPTYRVEMQPAFSKYEEIIVIEDLFMNFRAIRNHFTVWRLIIMSRIYYFSFRPLRIQSLSNCW